MFSTLYGRIFGRKASENNFNTSSPLEAHASTIAEEQDTSYEPPEFNTDAYRPMKVRCIGAGFSGILCALRYGMVTFHRYISFLTNAPTHFIIRFRQKIANLDFKIYDKQSTVGGTWCANTYPVSYRWTYYPLYTLKHKIGYCMRCT